MSTYREKKSLTNNSDVNISWLTGEDVISILRISTRTLSSYRTRGIIPFSQIGRKIYYKTSDIEEYLNQHYIKSNYQKKVAL